MSSLRQKVHDKVRLIKFRIWHKRDRKIYPVVRFELDDNHGNQWVEVIRDGDYSCGMDDVELMQFTGLLDKLGKEIYEGDIVKHWFYNEPRKVLNINGQWAVGITSRNKKGHIFAISLFSQPPISTEVIGNIYEDKELLK